MPNFTCRHNQLLKIRTRIFERKLTNTNVFFSNPQFLLGHTRKDVQKTLEWPLFNFSPTLALWLKYLTKFHVKNSRGRTMHCNCFWRPSFMLRTYRNRILLHPLMAGTRFSAHICALVKRGDGKESGGWTVPRQILHLLCYNRTFCFQNIKTKFQLLFNFPPRVEQIFCR